MNIPSRPIALYLSLVYPALAAINTETPSRQEFDRARRDYETATNEALEPIKRRYVDTLQQLLKGAVAANDVDTTAKIKEALSKLAPASVNNRLVGTRWVFPVNGRPREEKWMEFRGDGLLQVGWDSAPRTWKPLSGDRVLIHPYTSATFSFVIEFDSKLRKGRIIEGEFKGQTIDRVK